MTGNFYSCDGSGACEIPALSAPPVAMIIGDSRGAGGNYGVAGSITVTLDGVTATVNTTAAGAHGLIPGVPVFLDGCAVGGVYDTTGKLNGSHVVLSTPTTNTFTIACDLLGTVTADPKSSVIQVLHDWRVNDRNVLSLAFARLGKNFRVFNRGCSGQTTGRMVERFTRDIVNAKSGAELLTPSVVLIRGPGINDLNAQTTPDELPVFANIVKLVQMAQEMTPRPLVVLSTLMPVNGPSAPYTVARRNARLRLNSLIRSSFGLSNGVMIFDEASLATDSTGAQASYAGFRSGYTVDGLHDSGTYGVAASATLATLLSPLVQNAPPALTGDNAQEVPSVSASSRQRAANPLYTGSGALSGAGGSGTSATGQTYARNGTPTYAGTAAVARADGCGFDQQLAITAGANNDSVIHIWDFPSIAVGSTYQMKEHVRINSSANLKGIFAYVAQINAGGTEYWAAAMTPNGDGTSWPSGNYDLQFVSPVFTVQSGFTSSTQARNQLVFSGAATPTYLVGRSTIDKVGQ